MSHTTTESQTSLQIKRTYRASREQVFRAWTNPEALKKWFGPTDDFKTPIAEIDLQVGGKYRIQMVAPNGEKHTVGGVYKEIRSPERLVFTWMWEAGVSCGGSDPEPTVETLVTLDFHELADQTEVVLTHERFPNVESRNKHNEGWAGCLSRLEQGI